MWLPSQGLAPLEQQVAVAASASRTTTWSNLRFDASAGPVGIVVPVSDGTVLDWASDAWLEALQVATAPRVFAPVGASAVCPGETPIPHAFHVVGSTAHDVPLTAIEALILDDVGMVSVWADLYGLIVPPEAKADLEALSGVRFFVARFQAPGGVSETPTLRVVQEGGPAMVPLALTRAANKNLVVTTFTIGEGRAALTGTVEASMNVDALRWNAASQSSTYEDLREVTLLAVGPTGTVMEASSHEALAKNLSIAGGTDAVNGVVTTYFERASAYGDTTQEASLCTIAAAASLASTSTVSTACAAGKLAIVGGVNPCIEDPGANETPADSLRCGGISDDLALALAGMSPSASFLTRHTLLIEAGTAGLTLPIVFTGEARLDPWLNAGSVDVSDCANGSTSTTGSGSGASAGSGNPSTGAGTDSNEVVYSQTNVYSDVSCGCSGTADTYETHGDDYYYYDETTNSSSSSSGDTCSGDSSGDSGGDTCSGDSSGSSDSGSSCDGGSSSAESGDTCSGSSSSSSGDSCGGDSSSSGSSCDSGGSSGSSGCSGSNGDCSVTAGKRRLPKLSVLAFGAVALMAPLRRLTRKKKAR